VGLFSRGGVTSLPRSNCGADCPFCRGKNACTRQLHSDVQPHQCSNCKKRFHGNGEQP